MEKVTILLWVLICICWIGIGFISSFLIEQAYTKGNPKNPEKPPALARPFLIIGWPVLVIGYIATGFYANDKN